MKRLLLLLIFFPVILFGQTRRKNVVDSIKAATDVKHISEVIRNNRGVKVQGIQVSDSGEYVTIVVRVHIPEAGIIAALALLPLTGITTGNIVAGWLPTVTIPPLPPVVVESDTIPPLPIAGVTQHTVGAPVTDADTVTVPPLPVVIPFIIATLPPLAFIPFSTKDVVTGRSDTVAIPPLPDVIPLVIDPLSACESIPLAIANRPTDKLDTMAVPSFEEKKMPVAGMHLSEEGYSLLEKLEGFSPELYALGDGGFTIGFGFFVPYSEGNKWDKGVTWEEAERLMRQKVPAYEDQVKQYINVPLTQREFDALTMLAYNLGGFSRATSIVNDINTEAGFDKLQSDWNRFVHSKAPGVTKGLMNRRRDEIKVRNESDYQPGRKIQVFKFR